MITLSLTLAEQLMVLRIFEGIPKGSLQQWEWIEKGREMLKDAETQAKVQTGEVIDNKIYKKLEKKGDEPSDVEFPEDIFGMVQDLFKQADAQKEIHKDFLSLARKFLLTEAPKE